MCANAGSTRKSHLHEVKTFNCYIPIDSSGALRSHIKRLDFTIQRHKVYPTVHYNSLSLSSCAFVAAFSASSKTKFLSESTSLGPDHLHKKQ